MSLRASQIVPPTAGLLIIDGPTVEALVTQQDAIDLAEAALRKTSNGIAQQDIRRTLDLPGADGACLSVMYAAPADRPLFGAKVLSVSPQNFGHGLPSHQGGVLLFEKEHGRPVALINGHAITGLRTPAASAVATRMLSRPEASSLAMIGYGEQAARHIEAIALVRPIRRVHVWGRDAQKAKQFAELQTAKGYPTTPHPTARDAVEAAEIVCTVTSAKYPVLEGKWISEGTHINAVGASIAALKELDADCVLRSSIWVDYMPMAMTSASDLFEPRADGSLDPAKIIGEIGAALNGAVRGRRDHSEITLYRSLGVPAQDIELANFIYQKAKDLGLGVEVSL
ncbi:ornithine cyclodeaminase family protein [Rhizobium sp. AG855]|uniref:ornithine cyclodeaminase family protein n=1 Tax=Rhizobium sp. AG855 TaxID=2183898 RepID=UPI000E70D983|nr:ornithine cyclodeaminase family protein [Rhizobium sp. AG855]RKE84655.1 ornithine cyclodeaminase [Rhizobium sp. AG855]